MPQVTVHFQGLCLFHAGGADDPVTVFLPDAHKSKTLIDGKPGYEHYAYLLLQQKGTGGTSLGHFDQVPLRSSLIEFAPAQGAVGKVTELENLPCFGKFSDDVDVDSFKTGPLGGHVCARVVLSGGELRGVRPPAPAGGGKRHWRIAEHLRQGKVKGDYKQFVGLYHSMKWTSDAATTTLRLNGQDIDLSLHGHKIVIGNRPDALTGWPQGDIWHGHDNDPTHPGCDHHFHWYYQLLESKNGKQLEQRVDRLVPKPCADSPQTSGGHGHAPLAPVDSMAQDAEADKVRPEMLSDAFPTCFCASCT